MKNDLEKINKVALKFLTPLTLSETYMTITKEVIALTKADEGAVLLAQGNALYVEFGSSPSIASMQPRPNGYSFQVYKERKALFIQETVIQKYMPDLNKQGVRSILFLPLSYKKQSIGALVLRFHKKKKFTSDQLKILTLFSTLASLAIRKTQLYDEAKSALEIRDSFISLASHELRTPLTSINGYIQLLLSRIKGTSTTEAKWMAELHRESVRLTELIKDMLDISRIKTNRLQLAYESKSIRTIIDTAVELHKETYPGATIAVEDTLPNNHDCIVADTEKLVRVFTAIFTSLVKISQTRSPAIAVTLSLEKDTIIVTIADNEKKTDFMNLEKMFTGNMYQEGFGLDLILARQLLQTHQAQTAVMKKEGIPTIEIRFPEVAMA